MKQWFSNDIWKGPDPHDERFVAKQLDDDGYFKILGNGMAEFKGKGRFYVFKKDEKSALEKKKNISGSLI